MKSKSEMGGDATSGGGDFRTKVWSMPGGPNCRPLHWKRNTAIAMFGIILTCIPIAMLSAKLEVPHFFANSLCVYTYIFFVSTHKVMYTCCVYYWVITRLLV